MNEVNRKPSEKEDRSGNHTWSGILTGILFIATCFLVLGFFLQSMLSTIKS